MRNEKENDATTSVVVATEIDVGVFVAYKTPTIESQRWPLICFPLYAAGSHKKQKCAWFLVAGVWP